MSNRRTRRSDDLPITRAVVFRVTRADFKQPHLKKGVEYLAQFRKGDSVGILNGTAGDFFGVLDVQEQQVYIAHVDAAPQYAYLERLNGRRMALNGGSRA